MTDQPGTGKLDVAGLRARYQAERERRLTGLGTDQFKFAEGALARFGDDPCAGPAPARAPRDETCEVLIIGAGLGGIQAGATLRRAGIDDIRIVDVAADFGGTWYWNRYPGLRCDVESYIYLPYLEETGFVPSERYVTGSEIFGYCQLLARHFGLYDRALLQTRISGLTWDAAARRWIATTDRGDTLRARYVTTQSGIFNRPQLPGIPGLETFAGRAFHSARWDYGFTGGGPDAPMDRLGDKRIGVIGTGTTAIQVVPQLAAAARSLTVFQRTPSAIGVRDNAPTDMTWFKGQAPGWQKAREDAFNRLASGEFVDCTIDDGWARFFRRMIAAADSVPAPARTPEAIGAAQEIADYAWNEEVRARVDLIVRNPEKAALLKAYYRTLCKRPGFSDDYLPVFNLDHVHLVDASGGIERIVPEGVVAGGRTYPLDGLVFCTGFELGTTWAHQAGYDVIGRTGQRLSDKWAPGLSTYHGLFSHGFPNLFFLGLTQTATTISVPHMLQEQIDHLTFILRHCQAAGLTTVEATAAAEAGWQEVMAAKCALRRPFQEACTPGYFNAEGQAGDRRSAIGSGIYFPSTEFFALWAAWRAAGRFDGLQLD